MSGRRRRSRPRFAQRGRSRDEHAAYFARQDSKAGGRYRLREQHDQADLRDTIRERP